MKIRLISTFCTLMLLGFMSMQAWGQTDTRSVWTNANGATIFDPQVSCVYLNFSGFNVATSWNEATVTPNPADAHFRGAAKALGLPISLCANRTYEFKLVASSATDNDSIAGTWDITRNGSVVCSACTGVVTGLSQAAGAGNFYELYVDDPGAGPATWLFSGYIDQRKDF